MDKFFNQQKQKPIRQTLRNRMTQAEKILWYYLRGRSLKGYKFRRQYGIGPYIVDFYCPTMRLAIEIDGDSHYRIGVKTKDMAKQNFIETQGICMLRFTDNEIREGLNQVIRIIQQHLDTPSNSPSERGRKNQFPPLLKGRPGGVNKQCTPSNSPSERGRKIKK